MGKLLNVCWQYLRAFICIYFCLFIGNTLSKLLPITIPGSIIGMLLLFMLLSFQLLPIPWVKPGCHILLRYMVLLFVPIGVGIMNYFDLIITHVKPLVASCIISTVVVFITVGYLTSYLDKKQHAAKKKHQKEK